MSNRPRYRCKSNSENSTCRRLENVCGASGAVKNGKSAGLTRFRCKASGCGKTWTALTGTGLARLRKREKWEPFQACLRERVTLAKSAERCGINIQTAFKWRHRMVSEARPVPKLDGVVEIDETYFYENEKGSRTVRQRRKPRKRGGGDRLGGTVQRPVLTAVARGSETIAWETLNMTQVPVQVMLEAVTSEDCVIVSDSHATFKSTCAFLNRKHEALNASQGERKRGIWHLNNVNNRHSRMKSTINHLHRGVATKYLDNYTNWLARQEFRPDQQVVPDFIADQLWLKHN